MDRQLIGGLSGGIIIEGSDRLYPFLKALPEKVLLLKHHPIGRTDNEELVTVNGVVAPNIPIRPGEAQFWQIGNIGADRFLRAKSNSPEPVSIPSVRYLSCIKSQYFTTRRDRFPELSQRRG